MSIAQLKKEGTRIWGKNWQTPMAQFLDVTDRTVRNWVSGKSPVKESVILALSTLKYPRGK
ncbi:MAG: hypothetical protein WCD70_14990 [Alphaproteobacteria bacterium]